MVIGEVQGDTEGRQASQSRTQMGNFWLILENEAYIYSDTDSCSLHCHENVTHYNTAHSQTLMVTYGKNFSVLGYESFSLHIEKEDFFNVSV